MSKHAGREGSTETSTPLGPPPSGPPQANGVHAGSNGSNGAHTGSNGTNGSNGSNGSYAADFTRQLPPTPAAETVPEAGGAAGREVTCPECGTVARVTVNRRESHDFCASCDFPLFWTPSQVVRDDSDAAAHAALKRLPGTAGRHTVGSLACPACSEANPINGATCLRCGSDLHPVAPPPRAPEPVAPPPPAPAPVKKSIWPWVVVGVLTLALVVAVVLVLVYG